MEQAFKGMVPIFYTPRAYLANLALLAGQLAGARVHADVSAVLFASLALLARCQVPGSTLVLIYEPYAGLLTCLSATWSLPLVCSLCLGGRNCLCAQWERIEKPL